MVSLTGFGAPVGWCPGDAFAPCTTSIDRVREDLDNAPTREVPWGVVDFASEPNARLVDQLARSWGSGIVYLAGVPWVPDRAPVLPEAAVEELLRQCSLRIWWSQELVLEAEHVSESLECGCLPLQVMPYDAADDLRGRLAPGLRDVVLAVRDADPEWTLPPLDSVLARVHEARSQLLLGS